LIIVGFCGVGNQGKCCKLSNSPTLLPLSVAINHYTRYVYARFKNRWLLPIQPELCPILNEHGHKNGHSPPSLGFYPYKTATFIV
jgi:hypothetical protein